MKLSILEDKKLTTAASFWQEFKDAELLKYAPGKRGLFQVKIEQSDYFVKVYPKKFLRKNRGEKIHQTGQKFWNLANSGKLNFRVPMPVFWNAKTQTLWQKRLEGIPAIEVLSSENIASQIGRAIANIANLKIVPPRIFDWNEQMNDSREFAEKLIEKFPKLKPKTENLLTLLSESHQSQPAQKLVPAHGDMHVDQWLFDGENLGLLDFEDFSHSEIERDLAFFAVQIEAEYGRQVCAESVEKDLISGFESAGKQLNKTIYEIYKTHKRLAKAAKISDKIEAARLLEKGFECLRRSNV